MRNRNSPLESARRILWGDRESLLPHLLEHRDCGVFQVVQELCCTAQWTLDSYVVAALFDSSELLVEVSK